MSTFLYCIYIKFAMFWYPSWHVKEEIKFHHILGLQAYLKTRLVKNYIWPSMLANKQGQDIQASQESSKTLQLRTKYVGPSVIFLYKHPPKLLWKFIPITENTTSDKHKILPLKHSWMAPNTMLQVRTNYVGMSITFFCSSILKRHAKLYCNDGQITLEQAENFCIQAFPNGV